MVSRRGFITGIAGILVAAQAPAILIPGRRPMVNPLRMGTTEFVFDQAYHAYLERGVAMILYSGAWPEISVFHVEPIREGIIARA
jgi:hypothetical protein